MKTHMGTFMGTVDEVRNFAASHDSHLLWFKCSARQCPSISQAMANVEGPDEEPLDEEAAAIEEQIAEEEEAIVAEEEVRTNEQ